MDDIAISMGEKKSMRDLSSKMNRIKAIKQGNATTQVTHNNNKREEGREGEESYNGSDDDSDNDSESTYSHSFDSHDNSYDDYEDHDEGNGSSIVHIKLHTGTNTRRSKHTSNVRKRERGRYDGDYGNINNKDSYKRGRRKASAVGSESHGRTSGHISRAHHRHRDRRLKKGTTPRRRGRDNITDNDTLDKHTHTKSRRMSNDSHSHGYGNDTLTSRSRDKQKEPHGVSTSVVSPEDVCMECESTEAIWICNDCHENYCSGCWMLIHARGKRIAHNREKYVKKMVRDRNDAAVSIQAVYRGYNLRKIGVDQYKWHADELRRVTFSVCIHNV